MKARGMEGACARQSSAHGAITPRPHPARRRRCRRRGEGLAQVTLCLRHALAQGGRPLPALFPTTAASGGPTGHGCGCRRRRTRTNQAMACEVILRQNRGWGWSVMIGACDTNLILNIECRQLVLEWDRSNPYRPPG